STRSPSGRRRRARRARCPSPVAICAFQPPLYGSPERSPLTELLPPRAGVPISESALTTVCGKRGGPIPEPSRGRNRIVRAISEKVAGFGLGGLTVGA